MSNKTTLQATVDRLNRYQWTHPYADNYLYFVSSWDMYLEDHTLIQPVRVCIPLHYNLQGQNYFFQASLDYPCLLSRLSVTEAERMLELTKKALNLATRAQYIVEGLSWSKEEVNDFLTKRSPSEE